MSRVATVATCALNQWAMDFQGNMERILDSVQRAKAAGARYRCGPELDVTGYSCGDHYHESDTLQGAWEVVCHIMQHPACADIMVDIGLPVSHKNVIYNCKLVFLNNPHVPMSLDGVEIICNGSGALQELGAADEVFSCLRHATTKTGGCYLFANQRGCDGGSGYFAGDACIGMNGEIVGCAAGYSLAQVEVVTATVDLETVRSYRSLFRSRCEQAAASPTYPRVQVDFSLCTEVACLPSCNPVVPCVPSVAQQVLETPACWLWDYLRRSGRKGLLLSLAGDVDSSATAAIVCCMCHKIVDAVAAGDDEVVCEIQRITEDGEYVPSDPRELCGRLLYTLHLPPPPPATHNANQMCLPSSAAQVAHQLAKEIGRLNLPVLKDIVDSSKARESKGKTLTEEEMAVMRNLQAMEYCGPYSMFSRLIYLWRNTYSLQQTGEKTKAFFRWFSQLRHKMTALATPYYVPGTGPPDVDWPLFYTHTWQFTAIDRAVEQFSNEKK